MPHSTLYIDNMQEKGSDRVMRRVGNQPSSRCLKKKNFTCSPSWAAPPKFILKKIQSKMLMSSTSFGFDSVSLLLYNSSAPPPQVLKEQHIYLDFKFAGVSGRSHVFSTKYQLRWPDGDAEGSFPRWLTFMALSQVGGELSWGWRPGPLVPFHVGLSVGYLNFLTEWWQCSKKECPESQEVETANFFKTWCGNWHCSTLMYSIGQRWGDIGFTSGWDHIK